MIAEFGEKCYAAVLPVTVAAERLDDDFDLIPSARIVRQQYKMSVACRCGAHVEWINTALHDPFIYQYADSYEGEVWSFQIIRTEIAEPPCDHWHEIPLCFPAQ